MNLTTKNLKIILLLVVVGFCVGIYLQDLQHRKSTEHAWTANRFNLERFDKITQYNKRMNSRNWRAMRDSIYGQLDSLMILRYRKEVDSLTELKSQEQKIQMEGGFSVSDK